MPRSVLEEISNGNIDITTIEDYQPIVRKIVSEWLFILEQGNLI